MLSFRTEFSPHPSPFKISHSSKLMLVGSCFSENIGKYLSVAKFQVLSNPYGILFNPVSLANSLEEIIEAKEYFETDLIEHNGLYHSMQHHSCFSGVNKTEVLAQINQSIAQAHDFLKQTDVLFLTFGTAWVYNYNEQTAGNCHKLPGHLFEKKMLSVTEVEKCTNQVLEKLKSFNPKLQIVLTLSPVRHLKDGFEENQVSKSILRTAIYQLKQHADFVHYFPAYELIMDDLRDYRFFADDMVHPSEQAVKYVWDKFSTTYFNEQTIFTLKKVEHLTAQLNHRAHFPESEAHQNFLKKLQAEIAEFEKETGITF
jgi:lysophospholipase L1-like esterase